MNVFTWHIQDCYVLSSSQHGFVKGKSCFTNFISFYEKMTCSVNEEKVVDVIANRILLQKRAARGLDRHTGGWVKNSLNGCTQSEVQSNWLLVTSGILQGSALGPGLLNVFINDLNERIKCTLSKFADIIKLGITVDLLYSRKTMWWNMDRLDLIM